MQSSNCEEREKCLEIIHLVLDSEATEAQEEYLRQHIDMCIQCLENFNIEKEIRTALKTRLESLKVPKDLVSTIKQKIAEA